MKKMYKVLCSGIWAVLAVVLVTGLAVPLTAQANDDIRVTIDGVRVSFDDQQPVIVDGRTLVPVRGVFEQLGFTPVWDRDARTATLTREDYTIVVTIDSATFTINGTAHTLDVPAQIMNGSTMLPLRAVLESVGYDLNWDAATRTVLITSRVTSGPFFTPHFAPPLVPPQEVDEPTEATPADEATDEVVEDEPIPVQLQTYEQTLVGRWYWSGIPYYVFNANGEGTMAGIPIAWSTNDGVLYICITPDDCGDVCPLPSEWFYEIEGDRLILTSVVMPGIMYAYTRGSELTAKTVASANQSLVGTWNWGRNPYFVFDANGEGTMADIPIAWSVNDGILYICITPDDCGDTCPLPSEWFYEVHGDTLLLVSVEFPELFYVYTRV